MPDRAPEPGEVRVANRWLSVDPFVRGMLDEKGGFMPALPLGSPMPGTAIGEVTESRSADVPVGSFVLHEAGWRDGATLPAAQCELLAPHASMPLQHYLGHLGMTGRTAYFGLLDAANPTPDDVLFVSAGAGAVGTVVAQIARIKGLTVIASAGGADKCALLAVLGVSAIVDRTAPGSLRDKAARGGADGISIYFDNVGGDHLNAAIDAARRNARFILCGMVGSYQDEEALRIDNPMRLVAKRLHLQGVAVPV